MRIRDWSSDVCSSDLSSRRRNLFCRNRRPAGDHAFGLDAVGPDRVVRDVAFVERSRPCRELPATADGADEIDRAHLDVVVHFAPRLGRRIVMVHDWLDLHAFVVSPLFTLLELFGAAVYRQTVLRT